MSIAEAATFVDRSAATVRRWAREGAIQAQKSGGIWLVLRNEVENASKGSYLVSRISTLNVDAYTTLHQAWGRVLSDVVRDDLPDIIDYQDFATAAPHEIGIIAGQLGDGTYEPKPLTAIEMPKDNIRSRPLSRLAIEDRLVYEAAVQSIARSVDSHLSNSVYSHRLLTNPSPTKFVRYFGTAFAQFESYYPSADFDGVCLKTDLTSFYEYIDYNQLLDSIDIDDSQQSVINLLRLLLRHWQSQSRVIGLPQGPNASGILANAYLLDADTTALSYAAGYARFSDDMKIFFVSAEEARQFAPRLVGSLRNVGLNLAPIKTTLTQVAEMRKDHRAMRRSAAQYDVELALAGSVKELREIFDGSVVDLDHINVSDFRFSLWRLGLLEDDYPLAKIIEILPRLPFAASIVADYLLRVGYRQGAADAICNYLLSEDNVHPWTEIQLLRLVGRFDNVPNRLVSRLRQLTEHEVGVLGDFATRVLGAVGSQHDSLRLKLMAKRTDLPVSRRRAAVIGAADIGGKSDRSWARALTTGGNPVEIQRAAKYVLGGHPIPPTLVQRRTPEWVDQLRRSAEEDGILRPREYSH